MMDGHIITFTTDKPYSAHCSCKEWKVERLDHQWQAEDEARVHLDNVRRARAANSRQPSLRQIAKHYRTMAETAEPRLAQMWNGMAEEIEQRIESKTLSDEDQPPLF